MKKISILFLALCLSACRAQTTYRGPQVQSVLKSQSENSAQLISMLESLDSESSGAQISLAFTELINLTAAHYQDGLEVHSIAYDQIPEIEDGNFLVQSSYQVNTVYSSWISQGALYQVARYETSDSQGYRGDVRLSKTDTRNDIDVLCTLSDPALFDEDMPKLSIARISQTPVQIEGDYDQQRLDQMLVNRQMQYILGVLGNYLSISPLSDPQLFRFSFTPAENGYIFSIELDDTGQYNRLADERMPERSQILERENSLISNYQSEEIWTDIYLSREGVIEKIYSTIRDSFQFASQDFQVLEEQKLFIHEVPSSQSLPFILDFFSSIEQQSLKVGSSFILRVPISTTS